MGVIPWGKGGTAAVEQGLRALPCSSSISQQFDLALLAAAAVPNLQCTGTLLSPLWRMPALQNASIV